MKKKFLIQLFCLFTICSFDLLPAHVGAVETPWSQVFQKQIEIWMSTLATKDTQFHDWKNSDIQIKTLGVNSHQWLVSILNRGKNIGYLVVAESPQNENGKKPSFVLLEYGLGEYILFDEVKAPKKGTSKQVYDGFSAYWEIVQNNVTRYIDAKTGERYPSIVKPGPAIMPTIEPHHFLTSKKDLLSVQPITTNETDPFDQIDWLIEGDSSTPLEKEAPPWKTLTAKEGTNPMVVTASLFQDEVVAPFTIGSVHVWENDITYVGVWDQGLRFLPSAYIDKVGYLYE